jgi:hypothetical protein
MPAIQRFSIPFGDLPFGQLRGTTPYPKRNIDAQDTIYKLGLMGYKARFYNPYIP